MVSLRVLAFDHEGRPIQFDTWLDNLHLYLLSDSKDSVSPFDLTSGAATAPPAAADSATRSQWLTHDAAACLAIRNDLPLAECAHFRQHTTTQALYDALVTRYSSPATAALGRLLLPYLFPELSASITVEDLVSHLRTSVARYRATVSAEFLDRNQPPMFITLYFIVTRLPDSLRSVRDHFLSLDPTSLTVDLLEQHLLASEISAVATSLLLRTSGLLLLVRSAAAARARVAGVVEVAAVVVEVVAGVVVGAAVEEVAAVGLVAGVGALVVAVEAAVGVAAVEAVGLVAVGLDLGVEALVVASGSSSSVGARPNRPSSSTCGKLHTQHRCFSCLDDAWHAEFGDEVKRPGCADLFRSGVAIFDLDFDVILSAMYALSANAEGDCYQCVPPDPGIAASALGASESRTLPGTAPAEALHTFMLDSGASRCFFRDNNTLTPLPALVPVRLADPSGGLVVARSSTVLQCPAVPSGSLSRLHLPSFSTNLVSTAALQDAMVTTTTPGGLSLYTLATERFGQDLPVLRRRSGRGGEFSSNLLQNFCHGEGILQSFMLPDSPQQNGIAERRIGLVMEVARTSMIHAATPHFLWPFAVQYAAHHLNLWPRVSLPKTSPTLRWTGEAGNASVFRVWGSRAFVHDTSADKLSTCPIPCVFLGFPPDAPGWLFYHSTSRCVFPLRMSHLTNPLLPYGPAPSRVSHVDPLPGTAPVEVAIGSGAARGAASGVAELGGADFEGAGSGGAEPRGEDEPGGAEPGGAEPAGVEPGGAESEGVEPGGAQLEGAECGGAGPWGAALSGGPACASQRLSPQQLREWLVRRAHLQSGAIGAGGAGDAAAGAGGAGATAGAGGTGGTAAAGFGGARTRGAGVTRSGGVGGAGAGDPTEHGAAGARGSGTGGAGAGGAGVLGVLNSTSLTPPLLCPPPDQSQLTLLSASPLPAPSPYTEKSGGLIERREPGSHPVLPVRTARRVPCSRRPLVLSTHAMALRLSSVPLRVPLPAPLESSLPEVPDPESDRARAASPIISLLLATVITDPSFKSTAASALVAELLYFAAASRLDYVSVLVAESASASPPSVGGECALGTDVLEDRQEDFECLAAAIPRFTSMLLASEGDPDAPDIPTLRSYGEAAAGFSACLEGALRSRGFSQRQGVDFFQTFSPTSKMTTIRVLLHIAAQRDYELHSLDFSTAFLQGSLHKEIWLRRPPGFTGTTLAAPGFAASTNHLSLFLRTDTSLLPFYILVYVDDLVFATADTNALTLVKLELQMRHTFTDLGPLALRLPVLLATAHFSL
ncbi:unnamed protein product [Closterium sp. NIES-53]